MPCVKCGSYTAETSSGFCKECAGKASSFIYTPQGEQRPFNDQSMGCFRREGVCSICGAAWSKPDSCDHMKASVKTPATRLPWDDYFLAICNAVKLRSIDVDTQNGAVITNPQHRIVSTGYNAFPAGVDDAFWPRERGALVKVPYVSVPRPLAAIKLAMASELSPEWKSDGKFYDVDKYMPMTHAEMNAVVSAGQDLHGCCIYTLLFPCHECAKAIITSGIRRVVYSTTREDISWAVAKELFIQAGVELVGPENP